MQNKISLFFERMYQRKNRTWLISALTVFLVSIPLILSSCASASSLPSATASGTTVSVAPISHKGTSVTTLSTQPASPTTSKSPAIISLHMVDASTGWAFTRPNLYSVGGYILRTIDGGRDWKNVSPPYSSGQQYDDGEATAFLTSSIAWVVTARHRVYHTIDGGQTWQERQLSPPADSNATAYITFINSQDGWLLFSAPLTTGESLSIFRTTDGGNTWTAIATTGTSATQLPNGAYDWTVGFLDATTGWATGGYSALTNRARFYVTHDGGVTWQPQSLPLPTGETTVGLSALVPMFFTAQDGVLPVLFYATRHDEGLAVYVTHNRGLSWSSTAPLYTAVPQSNGAVQTLAGISLLDMNNTWVIGNSGTSLYTTQDGGQHWQTVSGPAPGGIQAISFVSHFTGWVLVSADPNTSFLYRTIDGGRSWTEILRILRSE